MLELRALQAARRMTSIDYCIVAVALVSVLVGVLRGFTREVLSLLTWILAFAIAALFGDRFAALLESRVADPSLRDGVACGLVFFAALIVGAVITHFATQAVRESRFSAFDRTLGAGVGVLRAVIVVVVFVLVAGRLGAAEDAWWRQSSIVPRFVELAQGFETLVPQRWLNLLSTAPGLNQTTSRTDS